MFTQTVSMPNNPITGTFGAGNIRIFTSSGTWTVPAGTAAVRARVWGGGGAGDASQGAGGGGGFSLRTIYDLTGVASVAVTVGAGAITNNATGGTSSFGAYCSATGGLGGGTARTGGSGSGGDINTSGGNGGPGSSAGGGGGAGSLFGTGGNGNATVGNNGGSGGGGNTSGGNGFLGSGAIPFNTQGASSAATWGNSATPFSIDFIGTGGGGASANHGINGGGGGSSCSGGLPGGGGGASFDALRTVGASGLVIVEW